MEESVDVKAFPAGPQAEAVLVARHGVADDLQVSVIVSCAFSSIYHAAAIKVFVLDISRAIVEVVVLEPDLAGDTCGVSGRLSVCVESGEVGRREEPVCLESPNVTPSHSFVGGIQEF